MLLPIKHSSSVVLCFWLIVDLRGVRILLGEKWLFLSRPVNQLYADSTLISSETDKRTSRVFMLKSQIVLAGQRELCHFLDNFMAARLIWIKKSQNLVREMGNRSAVLALSQFYVSPLHFSCFMKRTIRLIPNMSLNPAALCPLIRIDWRNEETSYKPLFHPGCCISWSATKA